MSERKVVGYECRNAMYFPARDSFTDDLILIKEKVHYDNGDVESRLKQINNYKRPVYIHKEAYRNYTQKKVWKPKREMDVYYCTEASVTDTIKKALGIPLGKHMSRKQLCRSPYVYGTDVAPTAIIKREYKKRWPANVSNASVAVLDIETNVLSPDGEIIAIALSMKDKAIIVTTKDFIGTTPLPEETFFKLLDKLTPEVRNERQCNVKFVIADTPALAVIEVFKCAHKWQPDFITGWNLMGFDVPEIIRNLEREGYEPADILSDPSVHPRFRKCVYHQGPTKKKMTSGKIGPLMNFEQWHWLEVPASFFFIDAMCLYYQVRRGGPMEDSYKLDDILTSNIGRGKVGIEEADHLDGVDKHIFMQTKYKMEYLVYNLFDCIGLEILDEKTGDIYNKLPVLIGVSDYGIYTSNPKRLVNALNFFIEESEEFQGVIGTVSDKMKLEIDEDVRSLNGWVVALPTERLIDNGMKFVKELPDYATKSHGQTSDIDVSSGYPNIEIAMNMSKDTTYHELIRVEGMTDEDMRVLGLNMLAGKVNSMEFANKLYKLPYPEKVWEVWQQQEIH